MFTDSTKEEPSYNEKAQLFERVPKTNTKRILFVYNRKQ